MNTDIRISTGLLTNMKVKRLIRRKGHTGFYNMISLWIYAGIHRPEGVFFEMDEDDLMDAADTNDENFIPLLTELKLLDFDGLHHKIHDWNKHNHWALGAEKRSETARKAAEARWNKNQKFEAKQ